MCIRDRTYSITLKLQQNIEDAISDKNHEKKWAIFMDKLALKGYIVKFSSVLRSYSVFFAENYSSKKIMCQRLFVNFEILSIFEISNANYGQMTIIIANFLLIFHEKDHLNILVEFESDRMSPRESAKNCAQTCMVPKYNHI